MNQYLPYGGLKCLNQKKINEFDGNSICKNSWIEYILEFDLKYPDELHDYSLAPEKHEVSGDMLSNYCRNTENE